MERYIQAGKFKAECLKIMDTVQATGKEVVITKRHIPIVRLTPLKKEESKIFGAMRGTIHIKGDLITPIGEAWDADS